MTLSYCAAQVRAQDIDRFHLALCAPSKSQPAMLAIAALNLELARTASRVSDPNLGLVRLQWWREVLDELKAGGPVRSHQVALALSSISEVLDFPSLYMMVEGRKLDLVDGPFEDQEELRAYLARTAGSLMVAQGRVLGLKNHEGIANHLGCAFAYVGLARNLLGGLGRETRGLEVWQTEPELALENLVAQALMHLERAIELRGAKQGSNALATLFSAGNLVKWWIKLIQQSSFGDAKLTRPLPFQLLRLICSRK